ncbi:Oxo-4-hydroxy-4-carboxy-5-ureidoimidazoline decarboxylase [Stachybotrys elegans]|uniref:Oxo-4-hydroxy-4-carboxy-5-ureidoimidazoline decarboxylase n=1 Tax=Stachybotrys elegans TaxID=80388 RepID=A0A8K0SCS5_9HYPO|nr:Oxo-4-hydroxy-4-carboxy-5-ureidoimidazoline decarboxylase [Stachybotrys elegans]
MDFTLPHIDVLHSCSDLTQVAVLDLLFEPSPSIHATLLPVIRTAEYHSYPELIDACQIQLLSIAAASSFDTPDPVLLSILGAHPRLGEKKVESVQSAAEQASLAGEGEELASLNKQYEETFPGLRYVVFVNGRSRPEVMEDMKARIARNDYEKEVDAALQVRAPTNPLADLRSR